MIQRYNVPKKVVPPVRIGISKEAAPERQRRDHEVIESAANLGSHNKDI